MTGQDWKLGKLAVSIVELFWMFFWTLFSSCELYFATYSSNLSPILLLVSPKCRSCDTRCSPVFLDIWFRIQNPFVYFPNKVDCVMDLLTDILNFSTTLILFPTFFMIFLHSSAKFSLCVASTNITVSYPPFLYQLSVFSFFFHVLFSICQNFPFLLLENIAPLI